MIESGWLRDRLAYVRTELANERTLLSWIRTALGLAGAGAVILRFGGEMSTRILGFALILIGGSALAGGVLRYRRTVRKIRSLETPAE